MLKGTDKVREESTAFHKGWNVTVAGYQVPQLSQDAYSKMKEPAREKDRVALNAGLVLSKTQMKVPKPQPVVAMPVAMVSQSIHFTLR